MIDGKNVHLEEMIIDRGEAEVDNHFLKTPKLLKFGFKMCGSM